MANVTLKKVQSGAALVKKLLDKADNGDGTLTGIEVQKSYKGYAGRFGGTTHPDKWTVDPKTAEVLLAAVNKTKSTGDRTVDGMKKGVDAALKEIKSADLDKNGSLTDIERKKVKTTLGKTLMNFSETHGSKSASSFKLTPETVNYVPSRPFRAPANATAPNLIDALVRHFNSYANDNSTHGPRPASITRYVISKTEAKGVVDELRKLPDAKAIAALRALSKRVVTAFPNRIEDPKRIYLDADAQKLVGALAKKLGVTVNLKGVVTAPKFDYY